MPTRRELLQWMSAGAAASLAARCGFAAEAAPQGSIPLKKDAKHSFELGLAAYTLSEFPFEKSIQMTKLVGLKNYCVHPLHIPTHTKADLVKQAVAKLKAAGLVPYACGVIYMESAKEVELAFEFAKNIGTNLIVGVPSPQFLPLVDKLVKEYDFRVAIHNHGPEDKVYPTPDAIMDQIKNLDPRIGLCMDIGHTVRNGVDPGKAAEKYADRLFEVHMKDENQATAKGTAVEVGRGVIDIPAFLRTLDNIHYSGKVSFEYEKDMKDPIPGLAESVGYVRGVMAAIATC